ncbi:DedA family protein/thiosulfate sulfurtransferase GlpE [Xanthomonas sp. LF07-6]|uniref:DedA family protein/thiosulfate sulfurtransferase GlpE n=1 Tax=Xanthomonas sp. LF07-6 TaxID=3097550 RepID=UPI002A80EF89|nr:DedA family protein/thiosulfate sulfurtransferase GlpE [Xanthomonas sp. LF07-6]MDY4340341.1 DedA family protein/thiosulfate sulfurtransferase GlpE [Xanthomonas sp. LF07-6]
MQDLIARYGLGLVFVNVLALSLGLPVPALPTLILVGATYALLDGAAMWSALLGALSVSIAASLVGDLLWFGAGRRYGNRTLQSLCRLSLSRDTCMKRTERFYARWGVRVLAVAKFVPGLSMVSVPMAGAMRVRPTAFLRYDALGAALWAGVGLLLGLCFADQVQDLLDWLSLLGRRAALLLVGLLALYVGYRAWRRQSLRKAMEMQRIDVDELHALLQGEAPPLLLDIRAPGYRTLEPFAIPGALEVDDRQVDALVARLPRDRRIVIYCACPNEVSAAILAKRLRQHAFESVLPLRGGLDAWRAAGHPLVAVDAAAAVAPPPKGDAIAA